MGGGDADETEDQQDGTGLSGLRSTSLSMAEASFTVTTQHDYDLDTYPILKYENACCKLYECLQPPTHPVIRDSALIGVL